MSSDDEFIYINCPSSSESEELFPWEDEPVYDWDTHSKSEESVEEAEPYAGLIGFSAPEAFIFPTDKARLSEKPSTFYATPAQCIVCFNKREFVGFRPCLHAAVCRVCAPRFQHCPVCRHAIDKREIHVDSKR